MRILRELRANPELVQEPGYLVTKKQFDGYVEPKYNKHCIFGMQSCVCIGHLTGKCCQCLYLCKSRQERLTIGISNFLLKDRWTFLDNNFFVIENCKYFAMYHIIDVGLRPQFENK